jgi:hypothetical protein
MKTLNTTPFPPALAYEGYPEIFRVDYHRGELRISLSFADRHHPVYVCFESCRGYRVLDEGDLLNFWNPDTRGQGWLWQVISGGWIDLESTRAGFLSGTLGYEEYLILGVNDCVSVMANTAPTIYNSDE